MIYAVKNNKVNRSIYKANEDALTSTIFERLMYLPKELVQYIFKTALFDMVPGLDLHQIESIEYWPNWDSENTTNTNRVEPDVFIRTATQDIIIEAKRYDVKQQSKTQWKNEIQAYYNEYQEEGRSLIFIALGGLHSKRTDEINVQGVKHKIYKCTWGAVLNTVQQITYTYQLNADYTNSNAAILNILNDIILGFSLFGFSTADWFERFLPVQNIKEDSITYVSQLWKS